MAQQATMERLDHHYHVLHGMQGGYRPNVNFFAEDMGMATDLAKREAEMDVEEGREVEQVTSREWHIIDGDTAYILEITDCYETDCHQSQ